MLSDRDIKTWENRLKDQSVRHWENYVHRRIDLSTARVDELFAIPGEFVYVEERSDLTAVAQIKLQKNTNDPLDLEKGVEIHTVFTQVYISNEALDGQWIDLIFGINFIYKKKIAVDEIEGLLNFLIGGPITTPAGIDLQITPGAGGITQIGDAGAQSHGLVNNDDLFVSGKLEVDGISYFDAIAVYYAGGRYYGWLEISANQGAYVRYDYVDEELTIPVGQGAAGVVSAVILAPASCTIISVCCRVIQAPGGGATTFDLGRTGGGNLDEFVDGNGPGGAVGVALGTTTTFCVNRDATTLSAILNRTADTFTLTTDANVLVSDMKVRIKSIYRIENPPTA